MPLLPRTWASAPGLTDVLVGAFAAGQDDEPLAEALQRRFVAAGKEVEWRGCEEVVAHRAAVEALQIERSAHADRDAEHVGEQAQRGDRVERTDRRARGDDLDVVDSNSRRGSPATTSWRMYSKNCRWIHACRPAVAFACEQHATVDAVDRVELHPAGVEQVADTRRPDGIARSPRRRRPLSGTPAPGCRSAPAHQRHVALRPAANTTSSTP